MRAKPFRISERMGSFRHAAIGVVTMLRTQHNARIQAVAAILVVALSFALRLAPWEWCAVLLATGLVLAAEGLNTAIEEIADLVSPERHPAVKAAKDVAAGAVLIAALMAAAVGALVFLPHLANLAVAFLARES